MTTCAATVVTKKSTDAPADTRRGIKNNATELIGDTPMVRVLT